MSRKHGGKLSRQKSTGTRTTKTNSRSYDPHDDFRGSNEPSGSRNTTPRRRQKTSWFTKLVRSFSCASTETVEVIVRQQPPERFVTPSSFQSSMDSGDDDNNQFEENENEDDDFMEYMSPSPVNTRGTPIRSSSQSNKSSNKSPKNFMNNFSPRIGRSRSRDERPRTPLTRSNSRGGGNGGVTASGGADLYQHYPINPSMAMIRSEDNVGILGGDYYNSPMRYPTTAPPPSTSSAPNSSFHRQSIHGSYSSYYPPGSSYYEGHPPPSANLYIAPPQPLPHTSAATPYQAYSHHPTSMLPLHQPSASPYWRQNANQHRTNAGYYPPNASSATADMVLPPSNLTPITSRNNPHAAQLHQQMAYQQYQSPAANRFTRSPSPTSAYHSPHTNNTSNINLHAVLYPTPAQVQAHAQTVALTRSRSRSGSPGMAAAIQASLALSNNNNNIIARRDNSNGNLLSTNTNTPNGRPRTAAEEEDYQVSLMIAEQELLLSEIARKRNNSNPNNSSNNNASSGRSHSSSNYNLRNSNGNTVNTNSSNYLSDNNINVNRSGFMNNNNGFEPHYLHNNNNNIRSFNNGNTNNSHNINNRNFNNSNVVRPPPLDAMLMVPRTGSHDSNNDHRSRSRSHSPGQSFPPSPTNLISTEANNFKNNMNNNMNNNPYLELQELRQRQLQQMHVTRNSGTNNNINNNNNNLNNNNMNQPRHISSSTTNNNAPNNNTNPRLASPKHRSPPPPSYMHQHPSARYSDPRPAQIIARSVSQNRPLVQLHPRPILNHSENSTNNSNNNSNNNPSNTVKTAPQRKFFQDSEDDEGEEEGENNLVKSNYRNEERLARELTPPPPAPLASLLNRPLPSHPSPVQTNTNIINNHNANNATGYNDATVGKSPSISTTPPPPPPSSSAGNTPLSPLSTAARLFGRAASLTINTSNNHNNSNNDANNTNNINNNNSNTASNTPPSAKSSSSISSYVDQGVSVPSLSGRRGSAVNLRPQIGFVNPLMNRKKTATRTPMNPSIDNNVDNKDTSNTTTNVYNTNGLESDNILLRSSESDIFGNGLIVGEGGDDKMKRRELIREQLARNRANVATLRQQLHHTNSQSNMNSNNNNDI